MKESIVHILGISAYYHDASAALVSDGEVVAAAAEERFTRQKHDASLPRYAIDFCLEHAGLSSRDLHAVVFYEEPHVKFTRVLTSTLADFPASGPHFVAAMKQWLGRKLWTKNEISAQLDVHPSRVHFIPHHVSHAAQAFYTSPFEDAAILTLDAVGEWTTTGLVRGDRASTPAIRELETIAYPHSLGLVYAAFTAFLGFRPNDGECSTMALAAFGQPTYVEQIRQVIRIEPDGGYTIDRRCFDLLSPDHRLFTRKFLDTFGQPRASGPEYPFDALADEPSRRPTDDERRYADIACSLQVVLEEAVLALAERLHRITATPRLCLAGGVALNVVANSRLLRESPFEELFIPPDPGDGGGSVGAALYGYYEHATSKPAKPCVVSPFMGKPTRVSRSRQILEDVDPADWAPYLASGCRAAGELQTCEHESFDALVDEVVADLLDGRIVGWVQGRFEFGPRALGNRSILVDPRHLASVHRLRQFVKRRSTFRPFALSITEEDAPRALAFDSAIPWPARWMQMVVPVRDTVIDAVRGAMHVDGTTRAQVCSQADNPRFHQLLSAFGRSRSLSALLNTSLNDSGYPIVASSEEAILVLARTEMDTLVIDNIVARKVRT